MSPQSVRQEAQAVELLTGAHADRALLVLAQALGLSPVHDGEGLASGAWRLVQLNHRPGAGVTGIFTVRVRAAPTSHRRGTRAPDEEALLCVSTAAMPPEAAVVSITWDDHDFSGWIWPDDPWLPGLRDGVRPDVDLMSCPGARAVPVAYRPTRRAVLRVDSDDPDSQPLAYVKVVRPGRLEDLLRRHRLLAQAQVPVPRVLRSTPRAAVALSHLPGPTAAAVMGHDGAPCLDPEHVLALLDRFPASLLDLPRRPSWTDRVMDYARSAATALPQEASEIHALATDINTQCAAAPEDDVDSPVHGDFHPGNVILGPHPLDPALGPITGLLDLDSAGPGRLSDDLACFVAHTWLITDDPHGPVAHPRLVRRYLEAFEHVVDGGDLRLRVAGTLLSLISVARRHGGTEAARRRLALAQTARRDAGM